MDSADNFQLHATRGLEPFLKGVADSKNVHVPRLKALSQKHELASADRQEILSLLTSLLCDHDLTVVVATHFQPVLLELLMRAESSQSSSRTFVTLSLL